VNESLILVIARILALGLSTDRSVLVFYLDREYEGKDGKKTIFDNGYPPWIRASGRTNRDMTR
jgi:hypothetical protein